jgi:hypothetical protein
MQRRVSIGPVMPVLHKKTYAGEGDPKPDPECGYDIAQADCVHAFHFGICVFGSPDQADSPP